MGPHLVCSERCDELGSDACADWLFLWTRDGLIFVSFLDVKLVDLSCEFFLLILSEYKKHDVKIEMKKKEE
jgi:hypothetical protein